MYLFLDTETTGLSHHNDHVVQLAWVLTDMAGNIKAEECHVVRPNGYSIPPSAARIHGITTAKACEIGQPLGSILQRFSDVATRATLVVAHNLSFDLGILQHDYKIACLPFPLHGKTQVCTMRLSTAWCRLPKLNGSTGFKYPRLDELHYRLFGVGFDGAHDALADTHACRRSYFELVRLGAITPPPRRLADEEVFFPPVFHDTALQQTKALAEQGVSSEQYNLGTMYFQKCDYEQAVYWFRQAAVQGNADGKNGLRNICFEAEQGDEDAQSALRMFGIDWSRELAVEPRPTMEKSSKPELVQPDEPPKKEWSYDSETKILVNNLTGIKYSPNRYEHHSYSGVSGFTIFFGPDTWANDNDVDYTNASRIETYVAASNKAAIEKSKKYSSKPKSELTQPDEPPKKEWSYDSETKILVNNFTGMEYWQKEFEHQRLSNTSGFRIYPGPDTWANDDDVNYTNGYTPTSVKITASSKTEICAAKVQNIASFAKELALPSPLLLDQLQAAGISKVHELDTISEQDKSQLLAHLRNEYKPSISTEKSSTESLSASGKAIFAPTASHNKVLQQTEVLAERSLSQINAQALMWCRKAATQGEVMAQIHLGVIYSDGHGVTQDYAQAIMWFRKAAAQGSAMAQYNLGTMYADGRSVPQDYVQAMMWYLIAKAGGITLSDQNLQQLEVHSTRAQIAKAKKMAREWLAVHQPTN